MIRQKKTKSGKLLEIDYYPVWNNGSRVPMRAPKEKPSRREQIEYNNRQAEKKLIRLINTNFDSDDIIMHPTYAPEFAPQNELQARRDIINYIRRIKNRRQNELIKITNEINELPKTETFQIRRLELEKRKLKLQQPLKYIYVIEKITYKTGRFAGNDNWHFHMFITGGLDRSEYEKSWSNSMRSNADIFQPDKYGPEAIAKYMVKNPQGKKRFCYSRNLKKPDVKHSDKKMTKRGIERIAKTRTDDTKYWENKFSGYKLIRCYSRYNEYNGYWYVSLVMYKSDNTIPEWEPDDPFYF